MKQKMGGMDEINILYLMMFTRAQVQIPRVRLESNSEG
jgi:hypothetical protein